MPGPYLFLEPRADARARALALRGQPGLPQPTGPLTDAQDAPQAPSWGGGGAGDQGPPQELPPDLASAMGQGAVPRGSMLPLARQRGLGLLGMVTGDPVLSGMGKEVVEGADKAEKTLAQQEYHQGQEELRRAQLGRLKEKDLASLQYQQAALGLKRQQAQNAARLGEMKLNMAREKLKQATLAGGDTAAIIGEGIISGTLPPELKGNNKLNPFVQAYLAKKGFNLPQAQAEWHAEKAHLAHLNSTQHQRLREAINFGYHSSDTVEDLYNQWKNVASQSGITLYNKANLLLSANMGGPVGAIAANLIGQINDLVAEMANVYQGGNTPTERALETASHNLKAEWDEPTFKMGLQLLRRNLQLRENAIRTLVPAGGENRYNTSPPAPAAHQKDKPPPGPAKTVTIIDPQGVEYDFDPRNPVPAGWRLK